MLWEVLDVKEVRYQLARRGTIERQLKGIIDNNWLVNYLDYHVTVRHKKEDFNRVFVLTEQEAKNILFV